MNTFWVTQISLFALPLLIFSYLGTYFISLYDSRITESRSNFPVVKVRYLDHISEWSYNHVKSEYFRIKKNPSWFGINAISRIWRLVKWVGLINKKMNSKSYLVIISWNFFLKNRSILGYFESLLTAVLLSFWPIKLKAFF